MAWVLHSTYPCRVWVLPVDADGDEVEDGGGAADDVEGDVEVAHHLGQAPHAPVHLQRGQKNTRVSSYHAR